MLQTNKGIDQDIKDQNAKYKRINGVFLCLDIVGSILVLVGVILTIVSYGTNFGFLYISCLDVFFTGVLVCCAFFLTNFLRKSTGWRPNMCLVYLHFVNTLLYTGTLAVFAYVLAEKYLVLEEEESTHQEVD